MLLAVLYTVIALFFGYFFVQIIGTAGAHRILHHKISGPVFRAHTDHHDTQYPPEDCLSATYRQPHWRNRPIWYYVPPAGLLTAAFFYFTPLYIAIALTIELIAIAWANDWIHEKIHIEGHWLERYKWFWRLRDLHWHHHVDESKNLGIFSWFTDKYISRTFEEPLSVPSYYKRLRPSKENVKLIDLVPLAKDIEVEQAQHVQG